MCVSCASAGDGNQQWLHDLDDILQLIPSSCSNPPLRDLRLNAPHQHKALWQPLLGSDNVGAFKTTMLALALWQRALRSDGVTERVLRECEMRCEEVSTLER